MYENTYGHNFKIGDVAYLANLDTFAIITTESARNSANTTPPNGIRMATKSEARKYRKELRRHNSKHFNEIMQKRGR